MYVAGGRRGSDIRLEVEKFPYNMAFWGMGGGSVMERWMRAFAAGNVMGRGGVSVGAASAFASSSAAPLPGIPLWLAMQAPHNFGLPTGSHLHLTSSSVAILPLISSPAGRLEAWPNQWSLLWPSCHCIYVWRRRRRSPMVGAGSLRVVWVMQLI